MPLDFEHLPGVILVPEAQMRPAFAEHMRAQIRDHVLHGAESFQVRIGGVLHHFALPKAEQILDFVAMRDVGIRRGNTVIAIISLLIPERASRYTSSRQAQGSYFYREFTYGFTPRNDEEEE